MLELILIVVLILWLLGHFAFGASALIHLLLVVVVVLVIFKLAQGRVR